MTKKVLIHERKQVALHLGGTREGKEKRNWGYYCSALTSHLYSHALLRQLKKGSEVNQYPEPPINSLSIAKILVLHAFDQMREKKIQSWRTQFFNKKPILC